MARLAEQPPGRDAFGGVSAALRTLRTEPSVDLAEPHQFEGAQPIRALERADTDFLSGAGGEVDWWQALVGLEPRRRR